MKKNLRSACLLFLVFLFFISGFAGLVSAVADSDYSFTHFNKSNYNSRWGDLSSPTSEYDIWGYTGRTYNFSTTFTKNYTMLNDTTVVFYWNCGDGEDSDPYDFNTTNTTNYSHKWNNPGTYYTSVGIFQNETPINVSFWVPIRIVNETNITVQNFFMLDENEGSDSDNSAQLYNIPDSAHSSENSTEYCGYVDNDYSFYANLSATSRTNKDKRTLSSEDNRTIDETITEVKWGDTTSDNSLNIDNSYDNNTEYVSISAGNFTHEWNITGEKKINATAFHWDPLDGGRRYSEINNTTSILIIQDPKNFVFYPLKGVSFNLHNWGILLSIIGLIIFYFTYTRNNVPIEISIFGLKPFYLRSVNSLTGTLIFVAGLYLYFVFDPLKGVSFNLHNWGILLSIIGLIIFYFTYTRNNVPIEISVFEWKPFYLRSVNSLTGTLIFVAGMYLYFVFGRCPWDIPIVSRLYSLSNLYFGILYYEYTTPLLGKTLLLGIPYLSILLGLVNVVILSLIIHLIAIPFYKGELKIGKFSRRKSSSTSVQPELISFQLKRK